EMPDLTSTCRLNPVTHPTEVIRRAELRLAQKGPDRLLDGLVRGALILIPTGMFVSVLAAVNGFLGYLVLGVALIAAGCSLATLETLLHASRPPLDLRAWKLISGLINTLRRN